ncbi:MAG: hypothetical protein NVSMB24_27400 [Mucilaginibacter sp.]
MKKYNIYKTMSILFCILIIASSCKKQDEFLDAKPNQSLVVPKTLSDYQALLNNTSIFNEGNDPALGELSSDDFYVLPAAFNVRTATERNAYTWAQQIYDADVTPPDWSGPYLQIYYANTVLDGLPNLKPANGQQSAYNQIIGSALFLRSYAFYNLVQTFALPYDAAKANGDLGIPLRLKADITVKSVRANEQTCYAQIISDLKKASPLLPIKTTFPTQPSRIAVNAMLARVYLAMSDYTNALHYANDCLSQYAALSDYNNLNSPTTTSVSSTFMDEDIYHSTMVNYSMIAVRRNSVADSSLYASYDGNDLRKVKFYALLSGFQRFVGSYDFNGYKFDGLATDEIYLIRAECFARAGNTASAMNDLNTLLSTRWKTGTFIPYTAVSADDALNQILTERRKELVFRGQRWTDLRRLNQDDRFKVTLQRNLNGAVYTLAPNDPKYALPIPDAEASLSGLTQNQR